MADERKIIGLLPPANASPLSWADAMRKASQLPPVANDSRIIIPTPEEVRQVTRGFIGPQQMSKRKKLRVVAGARTTPSQPHYKRYIVKLKDKTGRVKVGKIITTLELGEWAKKNEYSILRGFRLYGTVNAEREHTEITE
jgi:hypothetical protein